YWAPAWPTTQGPLSVLLSFRLGASTAVVLVTLQLSVVGQVGSPPPCTLAELLTLGDTLAWGVTGTTKLMLDPAARLAALTQFTCWPAAVQPAGKVPRVMLDGTKSVTVMGALVGAVPVLVTVKV